MDSLSRGLFLPSLYYVSSLLKLSLTHSFFLILFEDYYIVVALFCNKDQVFSPKVFNGFDRRIWVAGAPFYTLLFDNFYSMFFHFILSLCLIIVSSCPRFSFFVDHCWFWTLYVHVPMYVCEWQCRLKDIKWVYLGFLFLLVSCVR